MKSTTQDLNTAAAAALAGLLPSATKLMVTPTDASAVTADTSSAIVAAFIGEKSADFAVALVDPAAMTVASGPDSGLVSLEDVLRPALEAAADALGTGVLGDASQQDAGALFADAESAIYAIGGARGGAVGWVAVRIRANGVVTGATPKSEKSVVGKLGRISNVEMALTVEIGRTRMSIRDLLSLEPGAVIELDRSAGAPADVLLNGRLIAHGEIVVVDQDYAVRITKILDVVEGHS